ncbi:sugar kinase, partial [Pseudoalteromonas sp. S1727]
LCARVSGACVSEPGCKAAKAAAIVIQDAVAITAKDIFTRAMVDAQ